MVDLKLWTFRAFSRSSAVSAAAILMAACSSETEVADPLAEQPDDIQIVRDDDPVVARVNGTEIYRTDVQRAAAGQGLITMETPLIEGDPIFRITLDGLIDERLLALDAVRAGVDEQEEARRRLAAARERILSNLRVETLIEAEVTDEAIRDLYDRQRALGNRGDERRARHIVVETEEAASNVMTRLEEEEDFETLAAELSTDRNGRERGGDLGWVSRDMVAAPLQTAIFQTPVGGRAGPIAGPEGWYIIEVIDSRTPGQASFEDVREDIERYMTFEAVDTLMTDLREAAEINLVYQQNGSKAPQDGTPTDE